MPHNIFCLNLKPTEIAVYSYLMSCENRSNYKCYPSYRAIANALNTSINTVQKYVKSLEEKGLIETEHTSVYTSDGKKWNGNLLYTIKPISDAVDYYNQQQLAKAELENQQNMIMKRFENAGSNCKFEAS